MQGGGCESFALKEVSDVCFIHRSNVREKHRMWGNIWVQRDARKSGVFGAAEADATTAYQPYLTRGCISDPIHDVGSGRLGVLRGFHVCDGVGIPNELLEPHGRDARSCARCV